MPKPDTKMGGSGYPDEMMSYDPRTRRYVPNRTQWRRQRGYSDPAAELRGIAASQDNSLDPYYLEMRNEGRMSDTQDYVDWLQEKLRDKHEMLQSRMKATRSSMADAERKIRGMTRNGMSIPASRPQSTLTKQIMAENKKRKK